MGFLLLDVDPIAMVSEEGSGTVGVEVTVGGTSFGREGNGTARGPRERRDNAYRRGE